MGKSNLFYQLVIITILLPFVLGGCVGKSPPPQFYTLTPLTGKQYNNIQTTQIDDIAVGVGPVTIADYLDQGKIVTRNGENEIVRAEFNQWAGSFKNNIMEVLANNFGNLLGSERISTYPWRSYVSVDYQVLIDISRCDGRLGKNAELVARWRVFKGQEKQLVAMKRSTITEIVSSGGYAALVAAYSNALGELSREITETIRNESGMME